MPSAEELQYMINIVDPPADQREHCQRILLEVVKYIQAHADHFAAKKPQSRLSSPELRDLLKKLSKSLSKAAKQARDLGTYNSLLRSSLADKLQIEHKTSSSALANHLEICQQIVDDAAEHVIVLPGRPGRDSTAALAATYASSILVDFSNRPTSSTDGGALSLLATEIYRIVTGEEMDLRRYVTREVNHLKGQAGKSRK